MWMRGTALFFVMAAGLWAGAPAQASETKLSFDSIRRSFSLYPDEDLGARIDQSAVERAPAPMLLNEADPYFCAIIGQILAETAPLDRPAVSTASRLQETLGYYQE